MVGVDGTGGAPKEAADFVANRPSGFVAEWLEEVERLILRNAEGGESADGLAAKIW